MLVAECVVVSSAVNGTTKGSVAPVKNQDSCISCWHFQQRSLPTVLGRLLLEICDVVDSGRNGELMINAFIFCGEERHVHGGRLQLQ